MAPESIKEHALLLAVILVLLVGGLQVLVSLNASMELKLAATENIRLSSTDRTFTQQE